MAQYAFGVFAPPLEQEFGWTRAQINLSLSLGFLSGLISPLVGRLIDRYGARPVMAASLAMVAIGFALRPLVTELWQFYALSAAVFVGFPGATVLPSGRLIALWFPRTRGRMMGLVTAGNNFGGVTMVPLATVLVLASGWRASFAVFGLMMLALAGVAWLVVTDRPADVARARAGGPAHEKTGDRGDDGITGFTVNEALRTRAFYLMTAGLSAASFTYSAVLTQLILHLQSVGFSAGEASARLTAVAAFGIASKLAFGRLSEKITARYATVLSLFVQSLGLGLFILAGGSQLAWAAVVVFGLGFGGLGALIPLNVLEAFGVRYVGSILGIVAMVNIVPIIVGPYMAGRIFDATGSYNIAFAVTIGLFLAGALCMATAGTPRRPARAMAKR